MLTRRSLLGSSAALAGSAALAAGCSSFGRPFSPPSAPPDAEVKLAAYTRSIYLSLPYGEFDDRHRQ